MDEDIFYVISFCHFEQAVQVLQKRVHTYIAAQAYKVHFTVVVFYVFD